MVIPHPSTLIPRGASRREDSRLVTGHGRYTSDWSLPGQLHAAFLRADRAHAEIVGLDATRALAHPGVRAVLTGDDARAAGFKSLPNIVGYPGKDGQQIRKPHHPVLALGRVRFVGEAVAMVVADTAAIAEDARELIEVEYRDLPAVASFDAAVAPDAPQLHADVPGNLAFEYESGDAQAVAAAFARARHVSKLTMDSQRLVGNMLEPRACLVAFEPEGGRYTFYIPLQGLGGMRGQLALVSGVAADRIAIATQDVGGSFGVRGPAYPEYYAAMLAAKKLGRPVKWVGTRGETFMSDFQGRALSLTGEIALDADGKFLAIRFDHRADLGAYGGAFGAFIATRNLTITMGGVYRVPALYGRARLAYTNTAPVSAYRGAGRPDIAYAIERLVDYAAREHGFDPIELRRRNFIPPEAMPYQTPNAGQYDTGDFEGVMDDALERADWSGFAKRRAAAQRGGKLRGIGIATYLEAGGGGAAPKDQVAVQFDRDGGMTLYAVTHSSGQGHETTFPQIVAGVLGIDAAHVRFHPRPPAAELVGNGTGGSRGVLGTGSAFHVLGAKLIELARPHAAAALKAPASGLRYAKGRFHAGRRAIGFIELARRLAGARPHPFDTTAEGVYGMSYPNGCHIAEVEIDPETGAAEIARYVAVDDLGNIVNHTLVEGQVHGGVVQGAGQVFGEHAVYDPATAQLLTGSFMDYVMPRANWLRRIAVHDHPVPTPTNALGAKGVGESGCSGSLPALVNAAMDALRPLGITHLDMPLAPARLWAAIRQAQTRGDLATIRLFVSNSMRGVMSELIPQFERASGHPVSISYDPAKVMMERIARGETADLAILGGTAIEDLIKDGKVAAGSKRTIASCGVGVAVLAGAQKPDIGTPDAFKKALLAARSVAWTQEGASGMYFTKLIERLGIAEQLNAKAVRQPGGLIGELVAARKAELAIQQIPELLAVPGIELAGPLPREIQVTTVSVAGIFAGSGKPDAARALLDFLTTPAAARVFKAKGMEPA